MVDRTIKFQKYLFFKIKEQLWDLTLIFLKMTERQKIKKNQIKR